MTSPLLKAEIDLSAIAHNVKSLKALCNENVRFMPAVKANGYGHGAVEVAKTALLNGADSLGVARLEEAIQLREAGIDVPVLLFGYSSPEHSARLIDYTLFP